MNKVIKRFRAYAVALIFVLLTLLLGIINGINFTMASEDADRITAMLAEQQGMFARGESAQGGTAFTPGDRNFRTALFHQKNRNALLGFALRARDVQLLQLRIIDKRRAVVHGARGKIVLGECDDLMD